MPGGKQEGVRGDEVKLQPVDPSRLWLSSSSALSLALATGEGRYAANVCKPINASTY